MFLRINKKRKQHLLHYRQTFDDGHTEKGTYAFPSRKAADHAKKKIRMGEWK